MNFTVDFVWQIYESMRAFTKQLNAAEMPKLYAHSMSINQQFDSVKDRKKTDNQNLSNIWFPFDRNTDLVKLVVDYTKC